MNFAFIYSSYYYFLKATGNTCDIIDKAFERYSQIIAVISNNGRRRKKSTPVLISTPRKRYRNDPFYAGNLDELHVGLLSSCDDEPYLGMDESYTLAVNNGSIATLESNSIWGILRGLESFSQLMVFAGDGTAVNYYYFKNL